jgi:hypothetical protein
MIQDRLSDVLGELSRTRVAAYQIPNALARLCAQLGVQRLRRTPADEITRG